MQDHYREDCRLAGDVVSGATDAWSCFVERYTGLIFSVIRRYLFNEDEDERRNVYVGILEDLYTRRLSEYNGSSSLATWVVTVARSRSLDYLRARYGRRSPPAWLENCTEHEKDVYTLHYIEGMTTCDIAHRLSDDGSSISEMEVVDCLDELSRHMSHSLRTRLAYDLHARNGGSPLQALSDELRAQAEQSSERESPEYLLFLAEQQKELERLRRCVDQLSEQDRDVLQLYFEEGLTARETASRLGLASPRRAYTMVERVLRRLREIFPYVTEGRNVRKRAP